MLAISSAYGGCEAAVVSDRGSVVRRTREEIGLAAALPALIENLLDHAGRDFELVSVVVGPGSFTGLRAGIAVAAGIGLGLGIPVVGVTVAEALRAALPDLRGRTLWTAIEARRTRVFIDSGDGFRGWQTDALPQAGSPVAVCGNGANLVAATLAARGANVMLTAARAPAAEHVAGLGLRRLSGELPPLAVEPLYVDAAEAKLPAGGLRAAPA